MVSDVDVVVGAVVLVSAVVDNVVEVVVVTNVVAHGPS